MKRIYNEYTVLILAVALLFSSCRRPIEEVVDLRAVIPMGTLWEKAGIAPQNVTALFYSKNDGKLVLEHRFENSANRIQTYAYVPEGGYTVVVFNEIRGQLYGVGIRGYENLSTLESYATINSNPTVPLRLGDVPYVYEPDILASVTVRDFEVSCAMVRYTQNPEGQTPSPGMQESIEALVGLIPERKVHELNVTVHVEGLNNARMPALIDLNGMAGAYNFSGDRSTLQAVSQQFTINNRTYNPGSTTAGTISTTVRTFGIPGQQPSSLTPQPDRQIAMDFFFILKDRDRTVVHLRANVTGLIRYLPGQHGATTLEVEVDLPERLPDVEPEEGGSGFDSELIDWDVIDVPLTSK